MIILSLSRYGDNRSVIENVTPQLWLQYIWKIIISQDKHNNNLGDIWKLSVLLTFFASPSTVLSLFLATMFLATMILRMEINTGQVNWQAKLSYLMLFCHFYFQCSYFPPCRSSQSRIEFFMRDFIHKFTPIGKQLQCFHSTSRDENYVIRTRRYHTSHVVHGLFWTNIGVFTAISGLVYTYKRKKCTIV